MDTTDTSSTFDAELDVSVVSPTWAPGILDEEVLSAVFSAVADSKHTVVKAGSAGRSSENTTSVLLEDSLVCLNSD